MTSNDNHSTTFGLSPAVLDPHGRAALLLVESLIHGLCERTTITADQAIEIAQRAVDVQLEAAESADDEGAALWTSHGLLLAIVASLKTDGSGPLSPRLVT